MFKFIKTVSEFILYSIGYIAIFIGYVIAAYFVWIVFSNAVEHVHNRSHSDERVVTQEQIDELRKNNCDIINSLKKDNMTEEESKTYWTLVWNNC